MSQVCVGFVENLKVSKNLFKNDLQLSKLERVFV